MKTSGEVNEIVRNLPEVSEIIPRFNAHGEISEVFYWVSSFSIYFCRPIVFDSAMDSSSWRAPQGQMAQGPPQGGQAGGSGEVSAVPNAPPPATIDSGDWRTQLQADSRQRIVNKM